MLAEFRSCRTIVVAAVMIVIAVVLSGCGDKATPPGKPSENFVTRANGGTVALPGQVTVTIPPEAITQDAEVQISPVDAPPALPEGYGMASAAYRVALSAGQVTDTVFIGVNYLDRLLPEGVLEAALLIGRIEGQAWVFEDPAVSSVENMVRIGTPTLGIWAVVWRAMEPKATVSAMLADLSNYVSQRRRADLEAALGAPEVADVVSELQGYQSRLDAAAGDDPIIAAAVSDFLEANRNVENEGNRITPRLAEELATSFVRLGQAVGHYPAGIPTDPPRVRLGAYQFLPTAFARLFAGAPGYGLVWESNKTGRLQPRDSVMQHFFVQLNYHPSFGGVTYLDPPAGVQRTARILDVGPTGTYRLDLVREDLPGGRTVFYDYVRNRELALHWPADGDMLLFNLVGQDQGTTGVAYRVEFAGLLVDFGAARGNPFSSEAQSDTLGSWLYFGLPLADMVGLRKQDGQLILRLGAGSQTQQYPLWFPVNLRPQLVYGDWTAPSPITDLAVVEYRGNSVRVRWTAPGNDLDSGTATAYDLRYAGEPITEDNWSAAVPLQDEPLPAFHGTVQETLLLPFDLSAVGYLAITTRDDDFNISPLSNRLRLHDLGELIPAIPDHGLERVLRATIGKPEGTITGQDVIGVTEFAAPASGIVQLTGMEYLPNLTALDLYSNLQIAELRSLEHLLDLRRLRLSVNNVRDIGPLWRMKHLRYFEATSNKIADLAPLAGLTNLDSLNLAYNEVADLRPLARLTKLRYLELSSNHVGNVAPLRDLPDLVMVNLELNEIQDLTPLVENAGLGAGDTVDVRKNPLSRPTLYYQVPALLGRGVVLLYDSPW